MHVSFSFPADLDLIESFVKVFVNKFGLKIVSKDRKTNKYCSGGKHAFIKSCLDYWNALHVHASQVSPACHFKTSLSPVQPSSE